MIVFGIVIFAWLLWRVVWKLPGKWYWKAASGVLLAAGAFKFQLLFWFGGAFFAPELPQWLLRLSGWWFAALLLFFLLDVAWEVLYGMTVCGFLLWKKRVPETLCRVRVFAVAGLFAAALCLACVGVKEGLAFPRVRVEEVAVAGLPRELEDFTIVQLSDLHASSPVDRYFMERIVETVNSLHPDLVAVTGDFVDGSVAKLSDALRPLSELRAKYGVFGVVGNHEAYSGQRAWVARLNQFGVRMLMNEHVSLLSGRLAVGGVTDPGGRFPGVGEAPDIGRTFAGAPDGAVRVLLSHQVRFAPEYAKNRVALQLSGHTHGGMFWGLKQLVANRNGGYVSGFYKVGGMTLFVSNGTGIWQGVPFRLGAPPEIVLLTLKRRGRI